MRRSQNQQLARCVIFPFSSIRQATGSVSQYKLQFTPVELISSMYRLFQPPPHPANTPPLPSVIEFSAWRWNWTKTQTKCSYLKGPSKVLAFIYNPMQLGPWQTKQRFTCSTIFPPLTQGTTVHNQPPPDFIRCQLKPGHITPHFPVISTSILYLQRGQVLSSLQCFRVKIHTQYRTVTLSTHSTNPIPCIFNPTILSGEGYKPQRHLCNCHMSKTRCHIFTRYSTASFFVRFNVLTAQAVSSRPI
jgi:hypothetical protein